MVTQYGVRSKWYQEILFCFGAGKCPEGCLHDRRSSGQLERANQGSRPKHSRPYHRFSPQCRTIITHLLSTSGDAGVIYQYISQPTLRHARRKESSLSIIERVDVASLLSSTPPRP